MLWKIKNIILIGLAILILQNESIEAGSVSEELQINTSPEQYDVREIQKKLSDKCFRASGSNKTFIDLQTAKSNLSRCMSGLLGYPSVVAIEVYTAYSSGNISAIIEKYCNMKSDILSCFSSFMTTFERCMENNDETKFLHIVTKSLTAVSEYLCYNNGDLIKTLIEEGGLECWSNNLWKTQRCFYQSRSLKTMFMAAYKDGFVFNQDKCTDISKYDNCVLRELSICNNTVVTDFQSGLLNATNRILPCNFTVEI